MGQIREPAGAGRFYKKKEDALVEQIESSYLHDLGPGKLPSRKDSDLAGPVGLILPHAGYPYSGPFASWGFRWLSERGVPDQLVIVGTNHAGRGSPVSVQVEGSWSTPLGEIDIAEELAARLVSTCEPAREKNQNQLDRKAWSREHSIEVQLPFLQHLFGSEFDFVPVCVKDQGGEVAKKLGEALDRETEKKTALLASSDFTHYEPQNTVLEKDESALSAIGDLDPDLFYEKVGEGDISICGVGAIASLLYFSSRRGMSAEELSHGTSGDVTNMKREVVGYATVAMERVDNG